MTTLREEHIIWQNQPKDMEALREKAEEMDLPICVSCGCLGNNHCQHKCMSEELTCAILPSGKCPCCNIVDDNN